MSTILCLDDDAVIANMVGRVVTFLGHKPVVCYSSFEAIVQHRRGVNAAIVDYVMPRFDGLEVLAAIQEVNPACFRILLTAVPSTEKALLEAMASGLVQLIIVKPPSLLDLERALAWLPK